MYPLVDSKLQAATSLVHATKLTSMCITHHIAGSLRGTRTQLRYMQPSRAPLAGEHTSSGILGPKRHSQVRRVVELNEAANGLTHDVRPKLLTADRDPGRTLSGSLAGSAAALLPGELAIDLVCVETFITI